MMDHWAGASPDCSIGAVGENRDPSNYNHMVRSWLEYFTASSLAGMIKVNRIGIVGKSWAHRQALLVLFWHNWGRSTKVALHGFIS
jgi:hypothetical protein